MPCRWRAARAAPWLSRCLPACLPACLLLVSPSGQTLELLDALIDGMECGGEAAAQQLDFLLVPLLAELRAGRGRPASQAAVSLLGTLCERRPELAAELRAAGAVAGVAQHLLHGACRRAPSLALRCCMHLPAGCALPPEPLCCLMPSARCQHPLPRFHCMPVAAGSQEVQDVAARALWLLAKDDKKCLAAEQGLLGCEASALARMLVQLIEVADAEEVGGWVGCWGGECRAETGTASAAS